MQRRKRDFGSTFTAIKSSVFQLGLTNHYFINVQKIPVRNAVKCGIKVENFFINWFHSGQNSQHKLSFSYRFSEVKFSLRKT